MYFRAKRSSYPHRDNMSEKNANAENSMTEKKIVAKVAELMQTLDEVKKYEVLERHYKKFSAIVIVSIVIMILANILLPFSNLLVSFDPPQRFLLSFLIVVISPISGVVVGVFYIRRKIKAVNIGEWRDELSLGFPSALKILSEMNWDSSLETISSGGLGYAMYGLVKGIAYWIITYFALGLLFNLTTYIILHQTAVLGGASVWFSILIAFLYLKRDLSRRFNEIRAIDRLLWELRSLGYDLRNAEF